MDLGDPDELGAGMRKRLAAEPETGPGYTVSLSIGKGEGKGRIIWHRGSPGNLKKRD